MKTNTSCGYAVAHPVTIFWLGLLTGALIVGFAFLYGSMRANEYSASTFFRLVTPTTLKSTTLKSTTLLAPTNSVIPKAGTVSIGGDGVGL